MTKINNINLTEDEFFNGKPLFKVVSLENFLNSIGQFQRLMSVNVMENYLGPLIQNAEKPLPNL